MAVVLKQFDHEIFSAGIRDDDLYVVEVKEGQEFTIANMVELLADLKKLGGGRKLPILVLCKFLASPNMEFMNYLAQKDSNPYSAGAAFVLSSLNQKLMANFYLFVVKPHRPTKFFTDEEKAVEWLHNIKYE
jgi:hypothetical protein